MRRNWCTHALDVLCPCFRRRSSVSSALGGGSDRHDVGLNFILHGECNVGKTSLRNRWVDGIFTGDVAPTFGVDFNVKTLDLVEEVQEDEKHEEDEGMGEKRDEKNMGDSQPEVGKNGYKAKQAPCADLQVKINVYDTSGKPGYREVNSTYLLAFDAVLFVYDISSRSSLDELRRYFTNPEHRDKLAAKKEAGMAMLLIGNKCDLPLSEREVGSQTGQDMAADFGMPFVEVSAKTGANVREAFMFVTTRAVGEHLARARLRQGTGVRRRPLVRRTMQRVPGLQRALRARASVLDVFKGIRGRRDFAQNHKAGAVVVPPAGNTGSFSGSGGSANKVKRTDEGRGHPQGLPGGRRASDRPKRGEAGATPAPCRRTSRPLHPSGDDGASPRAGSTASHEVRDPRSPEARIGKGLTQTASLLERPEVSPMESLFRRGDAAVGGSFRPPFLDTTCGGVRPLQIPPASTAGPALPGQPPPRPGRRGRSPGGCLTPTHTPTSMLPIQQASSAASTGRQQQQQPASLSLTSASRSPEAATGPSGPLNPELVGGDIPRVLTADRGAATVASLKTGVAATSPSPSAGRRSDGASPERTTGGGGVLATVTEDSAARQLREASSFWLDKWGIKAAKTDATRGRHSRIKGNSQPPATLGLPES